MSFTRNFKNESKFVSERISLKMCFCFNMLCSLTLASCEKWDNFENFAAENVESRRVEMLFVFLNFGHDHSETFGQIYVKLTDHTDGSQRMNPGFSDKPCHSSENLLGPVVPCRAKARLSPPPLSPAALHSHCSSLTGPEQAWAAWSMDATVFLPAFFSSCSEIVELFSCISIPKHSHSSHCSSSRLCMLLSAWT